MFLAMQPHAISRKDCQEHVWQTSSALGTVYPACTSFGSRLRSLAIHSCDNEVLLTLELLSRRSFRLDGSIGAGVVAGGYMETQVRFVAASPPAEMLGIVGMIPWEDCTIGPSSVCRSMDALLLVPRFNN